MFQALKFIVQSLLNEDQLSMESLRAGMKASLKVRSKLWDYLLDRALAMPATLASDLYDDQAHNWARTEPKILSDFTARPSLFEMAMPVKVSSFSMWIDFCRSKIQIRADRNSNLHS